MNTNAIIGVVVAIVVVAGGVWYVMSHGSASAPAATSATSTATSANTTASGSTGTGTMAALIAMQGSFECNVQTTDSGTQSAGVIDVAGGKLHGTFTVNTNGKTVHAYMINDGTTVYSWSDAAPQGIKMPVTTKQGASPVQGNVNQDANLQYSCTPWAADPAAFVPPTSVTFMAVGGAH